jgi:aryl-alcohol dehydrogenase
VPQAFIPELIALYRQGRFPFDRLIRTYEFAEIADALADTAAGKVIKPVLKFPSSQIQTSDGCPEMPTCAAI